ncbi:MAG: response regulator transcription factor, partial [Deltaproteobacteria bacterium]|nr:response regulator transcription factor [Deltaproteobacteria bacterium]
MGTKMTGEEKLGHGAAGVLLVEDDAVAARMTAAHLESVGLVARGVSSLAEARVLLSRWRPELVLLDIELPDGDGIELCRELKNAEETADIPVMVLSGFDDKLSVISAFRAGAVDYLRKPYIREELLARV